MHQFTRVLAVAAFLAFTLPVALFASGDIRTAEVDGLLNAIERNYAPLDLKKTTIGLDWQAERQWHRERMLKAPTARYFYRLASHLLGTLQDAHVSVEFPSDYQMTLPLQFYYVEGKTIVTYVDKKIGHYAYRQISVGDELVSIDGHTPDEMRNALAPYLGIGNDTRHKAYLTLFLTKLEEKRGIPVPVRKTKQSMLVLRSHRSGGEYSVHANWQIAGTPILDRRLPAIPAPAPAPADPEEEPTWRASGSLSAVAEVRKIFELQNQMISTQLPNPLFFTDGKKEKDSKGSKIEIGKKEPFFPLPSSFKALNVGFLMQGLVQASGLYAGTFPYDGKRVGFLRIPSYVPTSPEMSLFAVREVMAKLEQESDYLLIDQTNNPGGYVLFSDFIVSALVGGIKPDKHMRFAVRPTDSFLRMFAMLIDLIERDEQKLFGTSLKYRYLPRLKAEYDKVSRAYQNYEPLSEPIALSLLSELVEDMLKQAFDRVAGDKFASLSRMIQGLFSAFGSGSTGVYTKPVYMLINELDFSGGDATPALLQDYGRVVLVGTTTAGAGGSVAAFRNDVLNSFSYRLTNSLMIRSGSTRYVENYGVKPDIEFDATVEDHINGFKGYLKRLLDTIDNGERLPR